MNNLKTWIHGMAAAAISAFASAASGAIALPTVFTFDRTGFLNMVKLATAVSYTHLDVYKRQGLRLAHRTAFDALRLRKRLWSADFAVRHPGPDAHSVEHGAADDHHCLLYTSRCV